jgi:DNA-binding NarL/FixJ family response regulator
MGLEMLLESGENIVVVGQAGSPAEALEVVEREQPDVILLDIDLGNSSGLDLIPQLLTRAGQARIIMLTGIRDSETHIRAVRQGAMGLVLKDKADETLINAIERVHDGEVWLTRTMIGSVLSERLNTAGDNRLNPEADKIATLTAREREVIELLAEGIKNKQIADRLFISETTVRHHLTSIFNKLGVSSRFELVIYSYRHGLAKSPV